MSKKTVTADPKVPAKLRSLIKWTGIPILIYFIVFVIFTWPWLPNFATHLYTDQGDGLQNVWNMWWIHESVINLHQLPWHTNLLHYPFGVTLIGQTLNPFNGFVALGLMMFMPLTQAYNTMVIFSFVIGGLTAFWLSYYFSRSYIASILGGAVFTFSSYHLAHAEGHMQLISLEWIPLFILMWWMFVKKPSYWLAVGSSISLFLVLFCDYYYFLYCLMAAIGIVMYFWFRKQLPSLKKAKNLKPLGLFLLTSLLVVAPLPLALLYANSTTEFSGSHPARVFSTDVLSPFIPGGFWRFHDLTDWYWSLLPANIFEATVYLGWSVIIVLLISLVKRKKFTSDLVFWQILVGVFGILSLGPRLMIFGKTIEQIPMPYVIMERVIPGMKLSGMPIRMMVMVTLGSAVIVAIVLAKFKFNTTKGRVLIGLFIVVFVIEMLPSSLPLTNIQYPNYVYKLKSLPSTGGVLDEAAKSPSIQLYYQTSYNKPMAFGYISRLPNELNNKEFPLFAYNTENKFDKFCSEFKIRYLTAPINKPRNTTFPIIYKDNQAIIYDLKNSSNC
ncbi:MAG: hypothetical protein Q7T74_04130 [Candidatus Saccharibacteria bacterium]|nr:hypothetical protein [Candidatus Saccharibacteria bacterium]